MGIEPWEVKLILLMECGFSYPGYNEILSGRADDQRIDSNAKTPNPNQTVLEQFANVYGKRNVAAFGSWDVFDAIINRKDLEFIQIVVSNPPLIIH